MEKLNQSITMSLTQTGANIESVLHEERLFRPPRSFVKAAHLRSLAEYRKLYKESVTAPDRFWAKRAKEEGKEKTILFCWSGHGLVDLPAYFARCDAMRKRLEARFGHPVRLEIEPGRYLVADSGFLVAEVRAVKQQDDNTFYLLDAGFNNLARPILYGAYHPLSIVPADGDTHRPQQEVIVGGPLSESGDIFPQEEGG